MTSTEYRNLIKLDRGTRGDEGRFVTMVDALEHIPIDRGSLQQGKVKRREFAGDDIAPFSAATYREIVTLARAKGGAGQGSLFGGASHTGGQGHLFATPHKDRDGKEGRWVTISGSHVFIRKGESVESALDRHTGGKSAAKPESSGVKEKNESAATGVDSEMLRGAGSTSPEAADTQLDTGKPARTQDEARAIGLVGSEAESYVTNPNFRELTRDERTARANFRTNDPSWRAYNVAKSSTPEAVARRLKEDAARKVMAKIDDAKAKNKAEDEAAFTAVSSDVSKRLLASGFRKEHASDSGSLYFVGEGADGRPIRVRVSDHEVPETAMRETAVASGGFSWTVSGHNLVVSRHTTDQDVNTFVSSLQRIQKPAKSAPTAAEYKAKAGNPTSFKELKAAHPDVDFEQSSIGPQIVRSASLTGVRADHANSAFYASYGRGKQSETIQEMHRFLNRLKAGDAQAIASVKARNYESGRISANLSAAAYAHRTGRGVIHLSATDLHPSASATPKLPDRFNGQALKFYWADALKVGHVVHPRTKARMEFTADRLDRLATNLSKALNAGVDVPIVRDHRETADSVVGYVFDAKREGDKLMVLHGFIGTDAEALAMRNKVSLGLDPNFHDSTGRAYGEAIRHSSLTPIPVIHGQTGFVPAAA